MNCIACSHNSGSPEKLCLCNDCQWHAYDHIKQHSLSPSCKQSNYDELDAIKRNISAEGSRCRGSDVLGYLENNCPAFVRFSNAITYYYKDGLKCVDWAKTLNKLCIKLDITTTKDFLFVCCEKGNNLEKDEIDNSDLFFFFSSD